MQKHYYFDRLSSFFFFFKKIFYLFIFRERGREGERERETSMCGCLSHGSHGDLVHNPGMCPDWELNQRPFDSQPTLNPLGHTSQGSPEDVKSSCHLCRASPWVALRCKSFPRLIGSSQQEAGSKDVKGDPQSLGCMWLSPHRPGPGSVLRGPTGLPLGTC